MRFLMDLYAFTQIIFPLRYYLPISLWNDHFWRPSLLQTFAELDLKAHYICNTWLSQLKYKSTKMIRV